MLQKSCFPTNLIETATELPFFLFFISSFSQPAFYIAPKVNFIKRRADFVTLVLQNDGTHCQQNKTQFFFQFIFLAFIWLSPKALYFHPAVLLSWYEPSLYPSALDSFVPCVTAWNKCHPLSFFQPIPINPHKAHLGNYLLCEVFFDFHFLL